MRASRAVCAGLLATYVLMAAACGDDDKQRVNGPADAGAGAGGDDATSEGGSGGQLPGEGGAGPTNRAGAPAEGGAQSACPPGPEGDPPGDYLAEFASGTRLEARYFASADMPDTFAGFFDTELNEWCDFMLASDDKLRCLPRSSAQLGHHGYSDDACLDDVWTFSPGCADNPGYVRRRLECLDKAEVRLLAPFSSALYYGPDNCTPSEDIAQPSSYTIGAAVPPSTFVEGQLLDLPGVCRASLRVVEATDGARGPFQAWDIASGAGCNSGFTGSCKPQRLAYEEPSLFTDDACEDMAADAYATWTNAPTCAPPDFIRSMTDDSVWYRPGALSEAELYSGLGGCEPARDRAWIGSIYERGEPVPITDLAPLEAVTLGGGALQVVAASEAGTPLIAASADQRFRDATLDVACYLRQLTDGSLRCIPSNIVSGNGIVDEYNDAACTQPLRRCQGDDCVGTLIFDETVDDQACSSDHPTTAIWRIKAPGTAYYRESPGFPCYAGGTLQPSQWTVEAVDPADLAEATLEVAP